jgi:putative Mg2+ transporter-C (MgtC) family protein
MAGQIVVGVGFLGAGTIMNRTPVVKGLTSAAVIWCLAAVGCLAAIEAYGAALVFTVLMLFTLAGIGALERRVPGLRRGAHAHADTGHEESPGG